MNITLFTAFDTKLNPYIILFKKALEKQGLRVKFERDFTLNWLISGGKSCDCIHLHWIKLSYTPQNNISCSRIHSYFVNNRFTLALLDFFCLIDFAFAFLCAKLAGKVIVFTVHDLYDYGRQSVRWKIQNEIARNIIFKFSDAIHVHNHFTRRIIKMRYRRVKGIFVIPHGNYIGYYPNEITKFEARQNLEIPQDAFTYLFLGLIKPYKGVEDLFETFIKMDSKNSILIVAGKIYGEEGYENKVRELCGRNSHIKMVPKFIEDKDIQIYLNAADIFVLPYKNITTSGAAALAFSFGKPIIAPNISSFPEIISEKTGVLYDVKNHDGLLSALKFARTKDWKSSIITGYSHRNNWEKIGIKLYEIYKKYYKPKKTQENYLY